MNDALLTDVAVEGAPTVYVVDDDISFGTWVTQLLESIQVQVEFYSRPSDFLANLDPDRFGCILLDMRLPEMSGMELHKHLIKERVLTPVMMITAFGEVSIAVEALQLGVLDFVQKPISAQSLIDRIQRVLNVARDRRQVTSQLSMIRDRLCSLSPRESEVLELLVDGQTTKQISATLGVGMTTVDFHRNNLLEKMKVDNVVRLTHLMDGYRQHCEAFGC